MNAEQFQTLFAEQTGVTLHPLTTLVPPERLLLFMCAACGCLFWPDVDGAWPADEVRLDWYMPVPFDNGKPMCQDLSCACHLVSGENRA